MEPLDAGTLVAAAEAARNAGAGQDAIDLASEALLQAPDCAAAWTTAASCLDAAQRPGEALSALRRAISLNPGCGTTRNALGLLLQARGHLHDATAEFTVATRLAPQSWIPSINLGLVLQRQGRQAEALSLFEKAASLAPEEPAAWHALGTARQFLHDPTGAEDAYRRALTLRPDYVEALGNLGRTLRGQGRLEEAATLYARALSLQPDHAESLWNSAILNMLRGEFAAGWEGMEVRWRLPGFPSKPRGFKQPLWNGEDIRGSRLLLHAEQGFGDTLQCLRYVPMVAARGAKIVLEVQRELMDLAAASGLPARLVAQGEVLPDFDWHCPLFSLPRAFGTLLDSVPAPIPYLCPPAAAQRRWQARMRRTDDMPRLGIVWAGRPTHANDANRSLRLSTLWPALAGAPWHIVSLQVGAAAQEIEALGLSEDIEDLSADLTSFAETAAALSQIDLLVAVDTAVVHLAGALGRPVRLLLPFAPDWRWLTDRVDTPWYPSITLLRQARAGDWSEPLARLSAMLRADTLIPAD